MQLEPNECVNLGWEALGIITILLALPFRIQTLSRRRLLITYT